MNYIAYYAGDAKTFKWLLSDYALFKVFMENNAWAKNANTHMARKLIVKHL